jgi:hypothetical protein
MPDDIKHLHACLRMTPAPQEPAPRRHSQPHAEPDCRPVAAITPSCPCLTWLRPFMPGANALTRAITAAILLQQGLLG